MGDLSRIPQALRNINAKVLSRPNSMLTTGRLFRSALLLALTQTPAVVGYPGAAQTGGQPAVQSVPLTDGRGVQSTQEAGAPAVLMAPVPFGVGEKMEYDVKFSSAKVGTGSMEVREIVDVRGKPAWHTVFNVKGKALVFFSVNITLESWFDVVSLNSLRFHQDQRYTGTRRVQKVEIFPERGIFHEEGKPEQVAMPAPLDDASMLYFVRTIPLEVGQTYVLNRYYKPDKNPVRVTVLRREEVTTPAGKFKTVVVQPKLKAGGLFGENGKAEVWLTDDSTRMMVQLKSDLSVGSINMYLSSYTLGAAIKP